MKFAIPCLFAACIATPAMACLPARPETLTAEWQQARQAEQWDASATVFVGRVVSTQRINLGEGPTSRLENDRLVSLVEIGSIGRSVTVRPVSALKGDLPEGDIVLRHLSGSMCGSYPNWDVLWGEVNDTYVVFSRSPAAQDTVVTTLSPERALDPRVTEALSAAPER